MSNKTLGENIKLYREEKGWNLSKLQKESKVAYSTLHDIENGKRENLKTDTLKKIADALDVTTNDLLNIEIEEFTVCDLAETIRAIFRSSELELDNIELSDDEKETLELMFKNTINSFRALRKK